MTAPRVRADVYRSLAPWRAAMFSIAVVFTSADALAQPEPEHTCVLNSTLPVRAKPGGRGRAVVLEQGSVVEMASSRGVWVRVRSGDTEGYAPGKRLRTVCVATPQPAAVSAEPAAPAPAAEPSPGRAVLIDPEAKPTTPEAAAVATPAEVKWYDQLSVHALVDGYYSLALEGPARRPSQARYFDRQNGSLSLAYAELSLGWTTELGGFQLDLGFGEVAAQTSYDFDAASGLYGANPQLQNIQQAYVVLKPWEALTLDIGKFVTTAGVELIETKDNWNYSHGLLFHWAIPYTHTGVRMTAELASSLSLQMSVVNGWDVVHDDNDLKSVGLALLLSVPSGTQASLAVYAGPEQPDGQLADARVLVDAIVAQTFFAGALTVKLNVDYAQERLVGSDETARWMGVAAYAHLRPSPAFALTLRGEHFIDDPAAPLRLATEVPAAAAMRDLAVSEGTLTLGVPFGAHAELRAEVRYDFATERLFVHGKQRQGTVQVGALGWF